MISRRRASSPPTGGMAVWCCIGSARPAMSRFSLGHAASRCWWALTPKRCQDIARRCSMLTADRSFSIPMPARALPSNASAKHTWHGLPLTLFRSEELSGHSEALLDAYRGSLILDPDAGTRTAFERERETHLARLAADTLQIGRAVRT